MTFQDIANRVYFLTGTSDSSYGFANLTLSVDRAIERVVSLINRSDSRWQWDDSNHSDLPSATLTITSGQQQYSLATTHLSIDRIEVKDSGGNWKRLLPIDHQNLKRGISGDGSVSGQIGSNVGGDVAIALGETTPSTGRTGAYKASTGVPTEYDVIGISFFLFPVPNFTQAASIRVYFTRAPLLFTYTTGGSSAVGTFTDSTGSISSSPGFNSLFHDLISLWASYDYGFAFGKKNANQIFLEIQRKEQELVEFYSRRDRDTRGRLSVSLESNK